MSAALLVLLTYILFFLVCLVRYTSYHLRVDLQIDSFYQIIFNLQMGMEGGEDVWKHAAIGFFNHYGPALAIMGILALFAFILCLKNGIEVFRLKREYRKLSLNQKKAHKAWLIGSLACTIGFASVLGITSLRELNRLGYFRYMELQNSDSNFYEANYVNPYDVNITFPVKKKNLVYIFMESMERSYSDPEHGGFYEGNLIPELTKLSLEKGEDFGDGKQLSGAVTTVSSTWTAAALVTQTTGSPLVYVDPHEGGNGYWDDSETPFLKNLKSLGNILQDNGYNNSFICGSLGTYAGRQNFFEQHGDYAFYDIETAREDGITPTKDYNVFWGMEDKYLFDYAKKIITQEAAKNEPFNVSMLTVDTHFPHGYLCEECPDPNSDPKFNGEQIKAVISCSDKQVSDFVDWIYQQPFGKDTVTVLVGDHANMSADLTAQMQGYGRQVYFTIINGPEYHGRVKKYSTLDMFPTTVAALGATIQGNRLGLGTNLYSNEFTLYESLGLSSLNEQIPAASDYYIHEILGMESSEQGDNGQPKGRK